MSRQTDADDSLPMIPWYWRDWMASESRALLSPLGRGVYRELLDQMWALGGSLPDDDRRLAALAGVDAKTWSRVREEVRERLQADGHGKLTQPRVAWQLERSKALRDRHREGALNATRAREERRSSVEQSARPADAERTLSVQTAHAERTDSTMLALRHQNQNQNQNQKRMLVAGIVGSVPETAIQQPAGGNVRLPHRLDPDRPANPLVDRPALQVELKAAYQELSQLTGRPADEVYASLVEWTDGQGRKRAGCINPAALGDDALLRAVHDARATLAHERRAAAGASGPRRVGQ